MKKYLLISDDPDESINAIITSTIELEHRVKKALEEHYDEEVEIVSVTELKSHPSELQVVVNQESMNNAIYFLEEVWEY